MSVAAAVLPDTTVLSSFAGVRRLELLEGWLRGRGRWVEAVAYEVNRGVAVVPGLAEVVAGGWLGDPIEITDMGAQRAVEHLRRDVFGGRPVEPLKHLGEAQTCYLPVSYTHLDVYKRQPTRRGPSSRGTPWLTWTLWACTR